MSNSRVRKQLEAREAKTKKYSEYKKIETLLLNYQVCKAYFHYQSASILNIVEMILKEKYNLPWQLKFIHKAVIDARGKKNPTIAIPQFKYEETEHDILSKFVKYNFEKIVADQKVNRDYPLEFKELMSKS